MSSAYIGNRVQNVDIGEELDKVTRVTLVVDSDHVYTAGDDTGRTIEREIPWGSQAMAEALLRKLSGVSYKPFNAERAMISPAFEIGDPVTVGGVYSRIIGADINYGVSGLVDLYAPDLDVMEDEYPAEKTQQSSIERQLARTRSLISKTTDEIRLEVSALDGKYTTLSVTIDGVTVTDSTGTTKIKGSSVETSTLKVNAANITGTLTVGNLPAGVAMTSDIPSDAKITVITNNAIRTASISADQVTAGTFTGGNLDLSGMMRLVDDSGNVYGFFGVGEGNASGVETTGVVLRNIYANTGFIATDGGARVYYGDNAMYCVPTGCFSTSEIKVSSDQRLKHSISYDFTKEEKMFLGLKPCSFAYNRDENRKRRWGFVAQDMVNSAELSGIDVDSLDIVTKDENGMYAIAYGEMVALNTHMIQRLMERVSALEAKG